jgi:ABC-type multidrug transport system fused ATPase/permease subunit
MIVSWLDMHIAYEATMIDFESSTSLLKQVAHKLLHLPINFHEKYNTARTVHTLHRGVDHVGELVFFIGRDLLPTVVQLILTIGILLWIGVIPSLTFIAFLPPLFYIIHQYGKKVQPLRHGYHKEMTRAAGHIGERIMNIRTVQDYAVEPRELQGYGTILARYLVLGRKRMKGHTWYLLYRDTVLNIARITTMGFGVWLVATSRMTPGILVLFITLTEKANVALFRMATVYDRAGDSMEGISAMVKLFEEKESITEKPNARHANNIEGSISFNDVSFAYTEGKPVLKDVSFSVPPKTMLAVIGRSGAGKSTIIKLLYRHYDVTSGAILVDGTDVRDYKLGEYRQSLALVPQDIEVFNASIRDNISFGTERKNISQKDIEHAASIAYAHDFIQSLPHGYDTIVGERGVKLSGGQRQRIGIARALLSKPKILIFDEATSSLDTESEQLIQKAMHEISREYTMIIIAHRLSTIEHADAVMVLEDGKIAEMGTHDDLLKQKNVYVKMRDLQRLGEVRE